MSNRIGRSVSVIGVGFTPLGNLETSPELSGLTERELVSWAALDAMEDGNIKAKDIDIFYIGQSGPNFSSKIKSAGPHFADWLGMRHKPSVFHDEGCGSGATGLQEAVMAVASGAYDTAISIGLGIHASSVVAGGYPLHVRKTYSKDEGTDAVYAGMDSCYEKVGAPGVLDASLTSYCKEYGVSIDDIDDAYTSYLIHQREQVLKNPKAIMVKSTYEAEAKHFGFDSVDEYLRSRRFNPKMGTFTRVRHLATASDCASAVIVCATELAHKYTDKPVEVAGFHAVSAPQHTWVEFPVPPIEECLQRAEEMAGITDPYNEIDHMQCFDSPPVSVIMGAEAAGYLKRGTGWQYLRDWKIGIDGEKPINTNGGLLQHGHGYGPSYGTQVAEVVAQMRGEAGEHQMPYRPHCSIVYGGGGGFNLGATVLKRIFE